MVFVRTIREGDELYHFSETTTLFPTKGYGREGYVILCDGVQVRNLFWVGGRSDYSVDVSSTNTGVAEPGTAPDRRGAKAFRDG